LRHTCFFFNASVSGIWTLVHECVQRVLQRYNNVQLCRSQAGKYTIWKLRRRLQPVQTNGYYVPLYDNHAWRHIKWFRCVNPGCLNCSAWLNDGHRSKLADNHFNVNKTVPYSVHKSRLVIQGVRLLVVKLMFFYYARARARVCVLRYLVRSDHYIDILDIIIIIYILYHLYSDL